MVVFNKVLVVIVLKLLLGVVFSLLDRYFWVKVESDVLVSNVEVVIILSVVSIVFFSMCWVDLLILLFMIIFLFL